MHRQALAPDHTVKVGLVHGKGFFPPFARDREPCVWASTAGYRPGDSFDSRTLELLQDLANEVGLTLEGELHTGGGVHRGSVGGWAGCATRIAVAASVVALRRPTALSRSGDAARRRLLAFQGANRRSHRPFISFGAAKSINHEQQIVVQFHVHDAAAWLIWSVDLLLQ